MFPGQTLTEEELDPVTGPKLMAAAGMYLDPRDSQAKDLGLQKTRAEINKLNSEAANGGEAYGKTGAIFLNPETGRYEAVQFGGRGQVKRTELGGPHAIEGRLLQPSVICLSTKPRVGRFATLEPTSLTPPA